MNSLKERFLALLRSSERYMKTDMVYLATSSWWMNLHIISVSLASLLIAILCANLLPPEVYGRYQYLLSFTAIFTALTMTGMNFALTQSIARGHEGMLQSAVKVQLIWGVVPFLVGVLIGGYFFLNGDVEFAIGIGAIGILIPLSNAFNTYSALLNGRKRFREGFYANIVVTTTYFLSMVCVIVLAKNALALLLVNLAVQALVLIGLYIYTVRYFKPNKSSDPEALQYGKKLSGIYAFALIVRQLDGILVFHVLGAVALAVYSIAVAIPERISGLFRFLLTAALPKFSVQSPESISSSLIDKTWKAAFAGLVVALLYVLCAPLIFSLLFPQYLASLPYSQFFAVVIIASAANLSVSALLSQRFTKELFVFTTLMPLLQLVLQVALIFPFGIYGVLSARLGVALLEILVSVLLFTRSPFTRPRS